MIDRSIIVTPKPGIRHHAKLAVGECYPARYTKIGVLPSTTVLNVDGHLIQVVGWTVEVVA